MNKIHLKYNTSLGIQASVERLFSFAGLILGMRRGALKDGNFEKQLLIKANQKLNPNLPRLKRKQSNLNDANCGRIPTFEDSDRIVGGEDTEPFEYPWNVALTLQWGLQFCGGSLINKWVSIKLKQLKKKRSLLAYKLDPQKNYKNIFVIIFQYVLTAAHCVAWGRAALKMKLRIGDHNLKGNLFDFKILVAQ